MPGIANLETPKASPKRSPRFASGTVPPKTPEANAAPAAEEKRNEEENIDWAGQDGRERRERIYAEEAAEIDRQGREELRSKAEAAVRESVSLTEVQRRMEASRPTEPLTAEEEAEKGWAGRMTEGMHPGKAAEKAREGRARAQAREEEAIRRAHAQLASEAVDDLIAEEKAEETERNWGSSELVLKPAPTRWQRIKSWFSGK